jgi:DNA-binding LytR/AlgR family response regulator
LLRFAVCDDQNTELLMLNRLLTHYGQARLDGDIRVDLYSSPSELLDRLTGGIQYDFYILDMIMPGYNGVEVGRAIREAGQESVIIFITASTDFALDAISVHPEQYLLKPLDPQKLYRALDESRNRSAIAGGAHLTVKTREGAETLNANGIVCLEHTGRIMRVYTHSGRVFESVCLRQPFETLAEPLLRLPEFLQTHKSYIVNLRHLRTVLPDSVRTDTGLVIPISRRNTAEVRRRYQDFISKTQL